MKSLNLLLVLLVLTFSAVTYAQPLRIAKLQHTPDHILGGMLLEVIYKKANIPLKLIIVPSARALVESSQGRIDGELQRIFKLGKAYPTLIRVPTPFTYFEAAAFSIKHQFSISGWSSLKGHRIGFVGGMKFAELGLEGIKTVHPVIGSDQLFKMLTKERLDIAVTARFNGLYHIKKLKLNSIRQLEPVIERQQLYHYLHEKHRNLIPIIDSVIKSMKESGELANIRKKFYDEILK